MSFYNIAKYSLNRNTWQYISSFWFALWFLLKAHFFIVCMIWENHFKRWNVSKSSLCSGQKKTVLLRLIHGLCLLFTQVHCQDHSVTLDFWLWVILWLTVWSVALLCSVLCFMNPVCNSALTVHGCVCTSRGLSHYSQDCSTLFFPPTAIAIIPIVPLHISGFSGVSQLFSSQGSF